MLMPWLRLDLTAVYQRKHIHNETVYIAYNNTKTVYTVYNKLKTHI